MPPSSCLPKCFYPTFCCPGIHCTTPKVPPCCDSSSTPSCPPINPGWDYLYAPCFRDCDQGTDTCTPLSKCPRPWDNPPNCEAPKGDFCPNARIIPIPDWASTCGRCGCVASDACKERAKRCRCVLCMSALCLQFEEEERKREQEEKERKAQEEKEKKEKEEKEKKDREEQKEEYAHFLSCLRNLQNSRVSQPYSSVILPQPSCQHGSADLRCLPNPL